MTFYRKDIFKFTLGRGSALVLETFLLKRKYKKQNTPQALKNFYFWETNYFHSVSSVSSYLVSLEKLRLSSSASQLAAAFLLNQPYCRTRCALLLASFLLLALLLLLQVSLYVNHRKKQSCSICIPYVCQASGQKRSWAVSFQILKCG